MSLVECGVVLWVKLDMSMWGREPRERNRLFGRFASLRATLDIHTCCEEEAKPPTQKIFQPHQIVHQEEVKKKNELHRYSS